MAIRQWFPIGRSTRIMDEIGTGMGITDGIPHAEHLSVVGAVVYILPDIFSLVNCGLAIEDVLRHATSP